MKRNAFFNKHPRMDYIQRCIRHARDPQFQELVLGYHRNPDLLSLEQHGNKWPDFSFYDIYMDYPSKGFFALLCQTLDALRYADRFNLVPVVTWSDRCLYKDKGEVNGSPNPFEYYFEPVSGFSRQDLSDALHVLAYHPYQRAWDRNHPFTVVSRTIVEGGFYNEYIRQNSLAWRKHLKLKEPVMDYIQKNMNNIGFDGSVLGIHVRATDFNKGYVNHAIAVQENQYIEAIHEALQKHPELQRVFLATDDQTTVETFEASFPGRIITFSDTFLSTDGEAIHFSQSQREYHKYRLGLEVIRDMYALSQCEGLIGSLSNVCIAAQIAKSAAGQSYQYLNVIDNGFNSTGKTTYQDHFGKRC